MHFCQSENLVKQFEFLGTSQGVAHLFVVYLNPDGTRPSTFFFNPIVGGGCCENKLGGREAEECPSTQLESRTTVVRPEYSRDIRLYYGNRDDFFQRRRSPRCY